VSAVDESGECWPHPAGPPNDLQESITYIEQCVLSSHNARKHWKVVRDAFGTMRQQLAESEKEKDVLRRRLVSALDELKALQARIDGLMLEYCPDEMTPEQVEEWGRNQVRCSPEEEAAINAAVGKAAK
jgi:hypothetical protein